MVLTGLRLQSAFRLIACFLSLAFVGLLYTTPAVAGSDLNKSSWTRFSYEPYPLARISDDANRYPAAKPKSKTVNEHGEIEHLANDVFGTHWFVRANENPRSPVWHFVTAGDPSKDVVLMIHGYPDTWWANAEVMTLLADEYYVIAVDVLGYGQSEKGPQVDVSYAAVAKSMARLLDTLGITKFNLIGHDRGVIVSENLIALNGMSKRILTFVRMQQSFDQPQGLPRPPHGLMSTVKFQSQEKLASTAYSSNYGSVHFPEAFLKRLDWEFGFEGTAEAAARTFIGTSFDIELEFRKANVLPKMTMPVLLIQGDRDPGQRAEEYLTSADLLPDARVAIVNTNHFIHAEDPHLVATLARELFKNGNTKRPDKIFSHPVNFQFPVKD